MAIKIVEVGPRDGLQNEKQIIETDVKCQFIESLIQTGIQSIELTSFVSPKWVPQMADNNALLKQVNIPENVNAISLVPNEKGLENAINAGARSIAIFAAASETFSQKNINCNIQESLDKFTNIIQVAKQKQLWVRGYISCVLGCPYEGDIKPHVVVSLANKLFHAGCDEISIGDTIGVGTPHKARSLIKDLKNYIPVSQLAVHFHDTYGQALANIYACLDEGIQIIDSSVSGLGGCPYAKGASGNVATEEVVYMLNGLGESTGIDLKKLILAGQAMCDILKIKNRSKVANALINKIKEGDDL